MTKIRGGDELCRAIVGYDANALYLWAIMQDMPAGWYTRRRAANGFRPQQAQPFGQMAVQWAKFFYVKGSHRPRPLTRFECFEYAKRRGHGRRVHAPD